MWLVFPAHEGNPARTKSNRESEEFPPTSAFVLKKADLYSKESHQSDKQTAEQTNEKEKMNMAFSNRRTNSNRALFRFGKFVSRKGDAEYRAQSSCDRRL
nr:MAG TPA: hypothetical protein [Caudoviricetes sp.]